MTAALWLLLLALATWLVLACHAVACRVDHDLAGLRAQADTERAQARIYRCGLCGWTTTRYSEIDGHEDQLEPGHLVALVGAP